VAEVEASQEVSPRGVIGQSSLPPPELAAEPVEPDPQQVTMLPVDEAPPAVATPPAVAEPPPAPQRLAKAEPAAAVAAPTAGAGLDWLRAAKGSHFTLQLASTQRETEAAALVKRHGLKGAHAWYPAERAGGRRYVLVYGDYPTRSAAQAALAKLPEALRAAKPWPRGIAQVQAELR
jgi:DamX protein